MNDLSLTILPETAKDAHAIERLHERTLGPGRFVLSAYRLREHVDHLLDLSFTARIGTLMVGSVRQLPVCIGDTPALMLGPLTVDPPFRSRGVGRMLLDRSLRDAKAKGHRLVVLVGDESYYSRVGFKAVPKGRASMPGPVDYGRLLVAELVDGAFTAGSGCLLISVVSLKPLPARTGKSFQWLTIENPSPQRSGSIRAFSLWRPSLAIRLRA